MTKASVASTCGLLRSSLDMLDTLISRNPPPLFFSSCPFQLVCRLSFDSRSSFHSIDLLPSTNRLSWLNMNFFFNKSIKSILKVILNALKEREDHTPTRNKNLGWGTPVNKV